MKARPQTRRDGEKISAKPKIFVSYAREDSSFIEKLTRDLDRDGFDVWLDRERMHGGDSIPAEIADAIKGSDFFLVVVSGSSNKSPWVRSELNKAVTWQTDSGRPRTIPIRRGNASIPAIVGDKHYIQFGPASYNDSYADLRSTLLAQPLPAARSSRKAAVLAAAVALLLAAVGAWIFVKPPPGVPTIVVRSFENDSRRPGDAWISTALGDILAAALRAGGGARIVDREEVSKAERDFFLAGEKPSPAGFRRRLGADYVVSGSFDRPLPDLAILTIFWTLADTTARGDLSPRETDGSLDSLVGLVANLADTIRSDAGLGTLSSQQKKDLLALFPKATRAQELYFAGVASYRSLDPSTAKRLLQDARAREPDHPLVYRRLASAAWYLMQDQEAESFAKRAKQLAQSLPDRERLEIELMEPRMTEKWDEVIPRYTKLCNIAPEEYSYWFELTYAQARNDAPNDALATLDALLTQRPTPPRYVQAQALYMKADIQDDLGQPRESLDLVNLAIENAKEAEAAYLQAEAQLLRSQILSRLGRHASAVNDLDAAQRMFTRAGDEAYVRGCTEQRAILQFFLGSRALSAVLEDLRKLEKAYRSEGANEEHARVLVLESMILSEQGKLGEAEARLKEAETVLGNENQDVLLSILIEQAFTLISSRQTNEADIVNLVNRITKETNAISSRTAIALTGLSEALYYHGRLEEAAKLQMRALRHHSGSLEAFDRFRLGMILAAQGKSEGRRTIEKAYELQEQMAESTYRAETALGLARLDNLAGDFRKAADRAESSEVVFRSTGKADFVALAQATRVWALTCEGDTGAAGKALEAATQRARESEDFRVRFETAIAAARFQACSNPRDAKVVQVLEQIVKEAEDQKLLFYAFDARLALGEIKLALGAGGQSDLRSLEADAARSEAGFHQIAQLAGRVLKEGPVCKALRKRTADALRSAG